MDKAGFYVGLCNQTRALLAGEHDLVSNAALTAALLYAELPDVNWVGFYFRKGADLVVGPFQGKPACMRIPLGKGVCGTAAQIGRSLIVQDVSKFDGHIVCDVASQSELVIPLLKGTDVVGVLDLDSTLLNRFDETDKRGCEAIVQAFLDTIEDCGMGWSGRTEECALIAMPVRNPNHPE